MDELWRQIGRYREHSAADRQALRRRERQVVRLREIIARRLVQQVEAALPPGELERVAARVAARDVDPYAAVDEMLASAKAGRAAVGRVPPRAGSMVANPADPE